MLATFGVVLGALICFGLQKELFWGLNSSDIKNLTDVNKSEIVMLVALAFFILFLFLPSSVNGTFSVSVNSLIDNYETALISNQL